MTERSFERCVAALLARSNEGVLLLDDRGEVVTGSGVVQRLLGHDLGAENYSLWDFVHPDDLSIARTTNARCRREPGSEHSAAVRLQHADGTWRFFSLRIQDLCNEPDVAGWVLNVTDVTAEHFSSSKDRSPSPRELLERFSESVVVVLDESITITSASETVERVMGFALDEFVGADATSFIHPDDIEFAVGEFSSLLETPGGVAHARFRMAHKTNTWQWGDFTAQNLLHDPVISGVVLVYHNIDEQMEAQQELAASEARFRSLAECAPVGVFSLTPEGRLQWANERWGTITGFEPTTVSRVSQLERIHPDDQERVFAQWSERDPMGAFETTYRWMHPDGELRSIAGSVVPVVDETGSLDSYVGTIDDITARVRTSALLELQARTDSLTELPNRTALQEQLDSILDEAGSSGEPVAVLFCDLDAFKYVNDSLGHHIGDLVLREVGRRLPYVLRDGDVVARFGGDEFVVICPGLNGEDAVELIAKRIADTISRPMMIGDHQLRTFVSVGVAVAYGEMSAEELIRDADVAMYAAKRRPAGSVELFTGGLREEVIEHHTIEQALRRAIAERKLTLTYQPILSVENGIAVAVEALCRWHDPELGEVEPSRFVPVAEATGLIGELGRWAIDGAARQAAALLASGHHLRMHVNVSASQLAEGDLLAVVDKALTDHDLPEGTLELEITESALVSHAEVAEETISELRRLGVRVAIDDFGVGYSSLAYLHRFDFDTLKLDRRFFSDERPERQRHQLAIVEAVTGLASSLGVATIAEGVEETWTDDAVRRLGITHVQGWRHGRPMTAEALASWLAVGDRIPATST